MSATDVDWEPEINRMSHWATAGCHAENRSTVRLRGPTVLSLRPSISSSKGSSPRIPIRKGSARFAVTAGHSMNLVKLYKNAAFTRYSTDDAQTGPGLYTATTTVSRTATAVQPKTVRRHACLCLDCHPDMQSYIPCCIAVGYAHREPVLKLPGELGVHAAFYLGSHSS